MLLNDLKAHLFSEEPTTVFAILDGAMVPGLPAHLNSFSPEYICLYRGPLEPDMAQVAPYLALLDRNAAFTDWVLTNGWGRRWGIFGTTKAGLPELRKHFRKFVQVSDASGKVYYFRFYDPAVLRNYLPKCSVEELKELFGPVQWYWMEEVEPRNGRRFLLVDNALREDRISIVQPHERLGEVSWKLEPS
ncbi:MAG TPA: DUF4123 domain-containing protein [Geobacter sp.]|nr:DUF4123 domain-containing protein [Geobacter sp.]